MAAAQQYVPALVEPEYPLRGALQETDNRLYHYNTAYQNQQVLDHYRATQQHMQYHAGVMKGLGHKLPQEDIMALNRMKDEIDIIDTVGRIQARVSETEAWGPQHYSKLPQGARGRFSFSPKDVMAARQRINSQAVMAKMKGQMPTSYLNL